MGGRRFRIESSLGVPRREAPAPSGALLAPGAAARPPSPSPAIDAAFGSDLEAMREAIATTRREMADLGRSPSAARSMNRAACELDAVALATEEATSGILSAVEEIESASQTLRASLPPGSRNDALDVIQERVLSLYETCNFQDIAGQRIGKVLATLHFVERRLDRVIAAWAAVGAPAHEADGPALASGTSLAGPRLAGDPGHISQSEIDALFA